MANFGAIKYNKKYNTKQRIPAHLSLYYIKDADVAVIVSSVFRSGNHDVLALKQAPHHI